MASFAEYQPSILPAWLQGPNGLTYAGVLGSLKDDISNGARYAATAGMPYSGQQPDVLAAIGYERGLPRYPSETDAQYQGRLLGAWEAWERAGTPLGILLQLEVIYPGIPIVLVQQAERAFYLDMNTSLPPLERLIIVTLPGGGWTFGANGGLPLNQGFWSRFLLIFPGPLPPTWVGVVSPPTALTEPSLAEVNAITSLVLKWKPAKATFMGTWVVTSGTEWGWPLQTWGQGGLVWGGSVVKFDPTLY